MCVSWHSNVTLIKYLWRSYKRRTLSYTHSLSLSAVLPFLSLSRCIKITKWIKHQHSNLRQLKPAYLCCKRISNIWPKQRIRCSDKHSIQPKMASLYTFPTTLLACSLDESMYFISLNFKCQTMFSRASFAIEHALRYLNNNERWTEFISVCC